jgi:molybdopterin converting factor subunit 1
MAAGQPLDTLSPMKVVVMAFAGLKQVLGERKLEVDVPDSATVSALLDQLTDRYPALRDHLPALVCAVGEEYVPASHVLREGDAVALIPPVSGG